MKNRKVNMQKCGRNDLCPCGSGKKFKKCCEAKSNTKKIDAQIITPASASATTEEASKISRSFFQQVKQPLLRKEPEENS